MNAETKRILSTLVLLIGVIIYSLSVFAYMHDRFITKDTFGFLVEDIKYIRSRVDELSKRK